MMPGQAACRVSATDPPKEFSSDMRKAPSVRYRLLPYHLGILQASVPNICAYATSYPR